MLDCIFLCLFKIEGYKIKEWVIVLYNRHNRSGGYRMNEYDEALRDINTQFEKDTDTTFSMEIEDWEQKDINSNKIDTGDDTLDDCNTLHRIDNGKDFTGWGEV